MRHQALTSLLLLVLTLLLALPPAAAAAEVLQVSGPSRLQLGDRNRGYTVELPCLEVPSDQAGAATAWLRAQLPRHSRVNLRPMGERDGTLLARVLRLEGSLDVGEGLIAAGLAQPRECP